MFKAVVFDLFETLVTQRDTAVPRAGSLGESLGVDARAYRREWKQLRPLALRGELTFQEALIEAGSRMQVVIPADRVQRASDDRNRASADVFQKVTPGIIAMTRELKDRGVRLGVISNCMAEDVTPWTTCALAPYFRTAVFSCEARLVKPDPRIYLHTIEQLEVKASEALYVGDGGDDELAGAERAGLRAAQAGWFVSQAHVDEVPVLGSPRDVIPLVLGG